MAIIVTRRQQIFEHDFDVGQVMDFVNKQFAYGVWPILGKDYEVKINE